MHITIPQAHMAYAVYVENGVEELITTATSIACPYECGYNWFPSSKVLELVLPSDLGGTTYTAGTNFSINHDVITSKAMSLANSKWSLHVRS